MSARDSFVSTLRQHRERQGLTLQSVADATKVSPFLLESLERGDVSRWPGGLYRRSFIRAYAVAIGLPPESTLQEFVHLFPETGQSAIELAEERGDGARIALMPESRWQAFGRLGTAAALDLGAIAALGYGASATAGLNIWAATATVAVLYHALGTLLFGQSPAMRGLSIVLLARRTPATETALGELSREWADDWLEPAERSTRIAS